MKAKNRGDTGGGRILRGFSFSALAAGIFLLVIFTLSRYQFTSRSGLASGHNGPNRITPLPQNQPRKPSAVAGPIENKAGQPVNPADLQKIADLKQILKSKNDNDPRLDTEFNSLSDDAKRLMRQEYKALRPESFNERGTIVFLLGRNLKNPEDFEFLADVLKEPPCKNMADCSKPAPPPTKGEFADTESINGVTLAYPQLVSLKGLENALSNGDLPPSLKELAQRDLQIGEISRNPRVAAMAQEIVQRFRH